MQQVYQFLISILPTQHLGGAAFFLMLYAGAPFLFGLIVTAGNWRTVWRALVFWHGGLFAGLFLMSFSLNDTLHGALLYGMFFSVVAVPVLALTLKIGAFVRGRLSHA